YALSTDGKLLAASFSSNTVLVWRLPGGLLVHRLQSHVHSFAVTSLSFSPSGHVLVSGSEDETAILWNVQHGSVLRRLTGHRSRLNYTVYSPNGVLIATSSLDRSVKIWDASTGACQGSFRFNEDIYQLIFSPDSSRLCIQTFGSCSIYDAQSYRRIALLRQNTALEPIGFSMSRQGDRVVTGASPGNQMRIWDAVTGRQLLPINDNKRKPSYAVAFSPDGAEVLAVARKEDRCACECYALSTDGKLLAASFSSSDIIVWRLPDGLLVQRLRAQSHRNNIRCLSFSSDGHALVSGSSDLDNNVIVWDVQRSHVLLQLEGHQSWWIDCVAYAPDNTLIATSDVSRSVKIWDASTGVCLKNLSLDKHPYWLTFSPDSLRLYLRTSDSCFIYDVRSYRRIAVLQHGENDAIQLSVSRQGDRVVSGGYSENGVKIWDAVTGQELLTINDERKPTPPVAFSPDGAEILAVCEADQTAQALAYDSQTGRLRNIFKLSHKPDCIAYSPNGDYVAFAARSGSLEVYDAKSRTFIGEVEGFGNGARMKEAEFLPDGLTILSHFEENSHESLRLCNVHDLVRMR
ncbi:uncharacterized protein PHACADRAFT_86654, partial [Phanerochaete carnosa HHB-10118-sp]